MRVERRKKRGGDEPLTRCPLLFFLVEALELLLSSIPIHLTAHASDDPHLPGPQGQSGEEAPNVEHPVLRVLQVNKPDLHEHLLEVVVHPLQLKAVCQTGHRRGFDFFSNKKDLITDDHDRLRQIKRGKTGRGNLRYCVAVAKVLV